MARGLKVLISNAGEDTGGVAIAVQRAFERYAPGWDVRAMRGFNNSIDYPVHYEWDRPLFDELWDWADVIHTMENIDNLIAYRNPPGKPIVLHHHGEIYRRNYDHLNKIATDHNLVTMGSTIDLEAHGTTWLPNPIDVIWMQAIRAQYKPPDRRARLRFSHSPTAHRAAKGTDQWVPAVRRVGGEMLLIQSQPWHTALRMKASADVHLDQLYHGYGLSGLEAMAMKMPVMSGGSAAIEGQIIAKVGYLPYKPAMDRVDEAIAEMTDPSTRAEFADVGWQYVNDHHEQRKVVTRLKQLYREAVRRYDPREGAWDGI